MPKTPILLLSDNASGTTGLGQIVRELADRIHADLSDVFKVGVLGVGGNHSSRLPYPNWGIRDLQNMIPTELPAIWEDFAQGEHGILMAIWNLSWLGWLAQPERLPPGFPMREFLGSGTSKPDSMSDEAWNKLNPQMQKVLGKKEDGPFKKWLYCPVDGDLPDGTLGFEGAPVLAGFDRVLGYTKYASGVIEKTFEKWNGKKVSIPNLPHGTDTSVFYPRDRTEARKNLIKRLSKGEKELPLFDDIILLGCIATNSFRKDWGLTFQVASELLARGKNVFLWAHTNIIGNDTNPQAYWNLIALAQQFGMGQRIILTTTQFSMDDIAWGLSACDAVIANGSGEGWGLVATQSLACGVPAIHGDYAGGTDFIPKEFLVPIEGNRLESKWMIRRPSFRPTDFADRIEFALTPEGKALAKLPEYIDWKNCWPEWKKWLLDGISAP
jgi:hypothetical protein